MKRGRHVGQGVMACLSSVVLDHGLKVNGYWNYHFWLWYCKWIHLSLLVCISPKRTAYKMDACILTEKIMLFLLSFRRTSEKFGFREKMLYLLTLNSSKYGTSTTLLANLTVKNLFIITNINLLFRDLKPFLSNTYASKNSLFTFLVAPFRYCNAAIEMLP